MARLVVPGYPHHVTQRGNRRQKTFFRARDYREYLDRVAEAKVDSGIEVWAYCLMPNHVHFVVVPARTDSLAALFAEAHRRYTRYINFRYQWRGHLWQERFHSCVMDERHLFAAARYVELNPLRAGLCDKPEDWPWSSARAHLAGQDDRIVTVDSMSGLIANWREYLRQPATTSEIDALRLNSRTGRPLGDDRFIEHLEDLTGRTLMRKKSGPKTDR